MIGVRDSKMVGTTERVMARNDVTVKLDAQVAKKAKMVAAAREITVAEYVSEILRPIVQRDLEAESARVLSDSSKVRKPKGGS
jgi:hypothetical protein